MQRLSGPVSRWGEVASILGKILFSILTVNESADLRDSIVLILGIVYRIMTFIGLVMFDREKQR